ncbi:MAG: restriction endonuclease subunit S [Nigerium sp.]|nr:restriction endonuclease subunit S [Nigerium sp.]
MTRRFQIKTVPSHLLDKAGRRLDCGPYMSGVLEAMERLARLPNEPLSRVTTGIFHAGRESRQWVESPDHGVPFLGSTDILAADLTRLPYLAKKQVLSNPSFILQEGYTLITRSGTIGRMAYCRSDMDGMACSEHAMRVVPDREAILPGYLYAFLSGRFGVPLVVSGTYGSIVQSIEPEHIAGLPVPRLGEVEQRAHDLVQHAARNRVKASRAAEEGILLFQSAARIPPLPPIQLGSVPFGATTVPVSACLSRLDGGFHSGYHSAAITSLEAGPLGTVTVRGLGVEIVEPKRFKRIHISDPVHGLPLFGTAALLWADPLPSYMIPKEMKGIDDLLVDENTVLIPRSGQISGILGTAILPFGDVVGAAVSEDAIRIRCENPTQAGFFYVALSSEYGRRQLKARAYGSSIPHLDVTQIGSVVIPKFSDTEMSTIGGLGRQSAALRDAAVACEREARLLVELAIERGDA